MDLQVGNSSIPQAQRSPPNQLPQIRNAYKPQRILAASPNNDNKQASYSKFMTKSFSQNSIRVAGLDTTTSYKDDPSAIYNIQMNLDLSLLQAKQEKFNSVKQLYAMEQKVLKLKKREDQLQKKLENQMKRDEELAMVRQSYDEKLAALKRAQMEREKQMNDYYEKNANNKSLSRMNKSEKINEIFSMKRESAVDVKAQRKNLDQEKERQKQEMLNQKYYSAQMIKQQQNQAKEKMNMYKNYKDQQRKISYIERVNMEKNKKDRNDQKAQQLMSVEQELLDKLKKSQELLRSTRRQGEPFSLTQSQSDMNFRSL
ncbi:UNKNOWN [Stylonychia lemnae]|uniref:Uncharacterized protein n=1 Tax=Stylonychia lemnae TaxID=5949 RepID=A0A078A982_STYLE|nr:UNKNOWN [Stylonychia lemnae]|eukprot:CDW78401.1 UNKNOWN [Stylonychia lemnae]